MRMTRREALRLAAAGPFVRLGLPRAPSPGAAGLDLDTLKRAPSRVVTAGGVAGTDHLRIERRWDGDLCRSRLVNTGRRLWGFRTLDQGFHASELAKVLPAVRRRD